MKRSNKTSLLSPLRSIRTRKSMLERRLSLLRRLRDNSLPNNKWKKKKLLKNLLKRPDRRLNS